LKTAFDVRMVLVRARNPLNMGAAARAMANFGFRDLALVAPFEAAWQEARSAVGAEEVMAAAARFSTLAEALADRTLVAGATTGQRRKLPGGLLALPDLPARIPPGARLALLFGSEKTGLTNEELSFCHFALRIPTVADCPSMNLGQAVAVCCYELRRAAARAVPEAGAPQPATMAEIEQFRGELEEALRAAGYFSRGHRAGDTEKLRRLLLRLQISGHDLDALRGMIAQIKWKLDRSDTDEPG
jgi:tRNA/rRNA methyltransferase